MGGPTYFPQPQADLLAVLSVPVQTVGSVTATVLEWTPPLNASTTVEVCLQGDESTAGTNAYSYIRYATVKNTGGSSSLQGAATSAHTAEAASAADVTITFPAGNTVRISAVGASGRTINWHTCTIRRKG